MTIGELLNWGREQLKETEAGDAGMIAAEALLSHLTGKTTASLIADTARRAPDTLIEAFEALIKRRAHGEPIAYLTGQKEFWSLALQVTPAVLIPRPETELLVEWALEWLHAGGRAAGSILEVGTGSGAIALALASELPGCVVVATDISCAALGVAKQNYSRLCSGLAQSDWASVEFCSGDWFQAVAGRRFDLIVSNPPYVAPQDKHLQCGDLRFEPKSALVSAENGLAALRRIIGEASEYLTSGGMLLLEHGYDQAFAVRRMFVENGFVLVATRCDLSGNERATSGVVGGPPSVSFP